MEGGGGTVFLFYHGKPALIYLNDTNKGNRDTHVDNRDLSKKGEMVVNVHTNVSTKHLSRML